MGDLEWGHARITSVEQVRGLGRALRSSGVCRPAAAALAALVALAVAESVGVAAAPDAGRRALSPSPGKPRLTPVESRYYSLAWRATVARDRACSGFAGPTFTTGFPSREITRPFAILRRPATPAALLPILLHHNLPPQHITNGWTLYNQELYLNQIRRARSAFGLSFYVIPAGNVTWEREVPARCGREQVAALKLRVGGLQPRERAQILAAQARYLAYVRYLTLHSEGICASYYRTYTRTLDIAHNLPSCATLAQLHNWGVLVEGNVDPRSCRRVLDGRTGRRRHGHASLRSQRQDGEAQRYENGATRQQRCCRKGALSSARQMWRLPPALKDRAARRGWPRDQPRCEHTRHGYAVSPLLLAAGAPAC
jgi:hypothetical protein